jgi:O-antigen ligase
LDPSKRSRICNVSDPVSSRAHVSCCLANPDRKRLVAVGAALFLMAVFSVIELDLIDIIIGKLGKDSALTGRTYIWSIGLKIFEWKPIFGIGFDAFWHADIFEEPRQIYAASGHAINRFHNIYLEVLVSLGLFGEAIFVVTVAAVLCRLSVWLILTRSVESLGGLYFASIVTAMSFVEILGFRNHDVSHILLVTFFVIAHRKLSEIHTGQNDASSPTREPNVNTKCKGNEWTCLHPISRNGDTSPSTITQCRRTFG